MKVITLPQGGGVTHVHKSQCRKIGQESDKENKLTYDDCGHYDVNSKAEVVSDVGGNCVFFGCTKGLKAR
jgi:hypothetical protein